MSMNERSHLTPAVRPGRKKILLGAVTTALTSAALVSPATVSPAHATVNDAPGVSVRIAAASHPIGSVISRHRIDVDGDGKADTVTLTRANEEHVSVAVATATRRTSRVLVEYYFGQYGPRTPLYGAAALDGAPGKELVVKTMMATHAMFFDVLTWRKNRLVHLRRPGDTGSGWVVDAYAGGAASIRVTGRGLGMRLITTSSDRPWSGVTVPFVTTSRIYAWRSGTWKPVTTTYRKDSAAAIPGGWYVKGLPRYRTD